MEESCHVTQCSPLIGQCRAGGGELASLGRGPDTAVEAAIMERVGVSDWWSGGNICPDSPGGCWLQLITYCMN